MSQRLDTNSQESGILSQESGRLSQRSKDSSRQRSSGREKLPDSSKWDCTGQRASPHAAYTYLYCNYDEVSSALQKACRRGLAQEAQQWAIDMFLSGSESLRTNTWNRLKTIAVEDIGPADPYALLAIEYLHSQAKNLGLQHQACFVAIAADILAKAKKTRVNDWMTGVYRGQKFADNLDSKLLSDLLYDAIDKNNLGQAWYVTEAMLAQNSKPVIRLFYKYPRFSNPSYVEVCSKIGLDNNWVKSGKHKLLLLHILNLQISGLLAKVSTKVEDIVKYIARDFNHAIKMVNLVVTKDKILLGIPGYAVDMHTARGKNAGANLIDFLEVGGKLENVDTDWEKISKYYVDKYWM